VAGIWMLSRSNIVEAETLDAPQPARRA
jgi:hypothetical protein